MDAFYLGGAFGKDYNDPGNDYNAIGFISSITFLILFNVMVPISLYVTLEMVKVAHALFINVDAAIYHSEVRV